MADALSRFRWQEFRQLAPGAQPTLTPVLHQLLSELTSFSLEQQCHALLM